MSPRHYCLAAPCPFCYPQSATSTMKPLMIRIWEDGPGDLMPVMSDHVPACEVQVRNGDCTCPKVDDLEWHQLVRVGELLAAARREGAEQQRRVREQAWDEGQRAGWDEASDRWSAGDTASDWWEAETKNPYRQEKPA